MWIDIDILSDSPSPGCSILSVFPRSDSPFTWPVKASLVFCRVSLTGCPCSRDWEEPTIRKRQGTFQSLVGILETRRRGGLLVQPAFFPRPMSLLLYIHQYITLSTTPTVSALPFPCYRRARWVSVSTSNQPFWSWYTLLVVLFIVLPGLMCSLEASGGHLTRSCTQVGIQVGIHSVNKEFWSHSNANSVVLVKWNEKKSWLITIVNGFPFYNYPSSRRSYRINDVSCLVIVSSRDMSISGEYHFGFRGAWGTEGTGIDASCRFQMLVVVTFIGQVNTSAIRLFPNAVDIFYLKNHDITQVMSSDDVPTRKFIMV